MGLPRLLEAYRHWTQVHPPTVTFGSLLILLNLFLYFATTSQQRPNDSTIAFNAYCIGSIIPLYISKSTSTPSPILHEVETPLDSILCDAHPACLTTDCTPYIWPYSFLYPFSVFRPRGVDIGSDLGSTPPSSRKRNLFI